MKILIIDDEIDLSLLLKSYFQRKGFHVYLSHSLSEGLEFIEKIDPDYLFLDNNLPDGLGWTEAPNIAAQHPKIQQFLISAYHPNIPTMPDNAHFTVLEKPISFSDLDTRFHTSTTSENEASSIDA